MGVLVCALAMPLLGRASMLHEIPLCEYKIPARKNNIEVLLRGRVSECEHRRLASASTGGSR